MIATRAADDLVCLAFVNMVGGQDELVFDGGSLVVNERGELVARGRAFAEDLVVADLDLDAVFRARLHDSAAAQGEAARRRGASRRIALPALPAPRAPALPPRARGAAGAGRRGLPGAGAGHARLRPQERLQARGDRAVGRHRLRLVAAIAVEALGRRTSSASPCRRRYSSAGTRARRRSGWPRTWASSSSACRSRPCFERSRADAGRAVQGAQGGRDRGEHPGPHPRHAADGAVATSSAGWC